VMHCTWRVAAGFSRGAGLRRYRLASTASGISLPTLPDLSTRVPSMLEGLKHRVY